MALVDIGWTIGLLRPVVLISELRGHLAAILSSRRFADMVNILQSRKLSACHIFDFTIALLLFHSWLYAARLFSYFISYFI